MVELLNEYKFYMDVDVIFDSQEDFLYRQKGQLKLDNSIIEEFMPWLMRPSVIPELWDDLFVGPTRCFSSVDFASSLDSPPSGGGLRVRSKDQDFAISRRLYIKTSHYSDFSRSAEQETYIAYVATEIKTNLDKTMFQEACATAHDVKSAVSGAKYYLICEWLDMKPLSTAATDIDEILIIRKAKRISSNIRKNYSNYEGRQRNREVFARYLRDNPFQVDVFMRFVEHIKELFNVEDPVEDDVLSQGYF